MVRSFFQLKKLPFTFTLGSSFTYCAFLDSKHTLYLSGKSNFVETS